MKPTLIAALLLLTGCGIAGLPRSGSAIVALTQDGVSMADAESQTKRGEACSQNILGLVASGDASVEAALRNGGISKVATIHRDIFGLTIYIPLYGKSCTIITGS